LPFEAARIGIEAARTWMLTSELGICPNWRSDDETNVDSNIGNFGDHEKWGVDHAKSGNLPI